MTPLVPCFLCVWHSLHILGLILTYPDIYENKDFFFTVIKAYILVHVVYLNLFGPSMGKCPNNGNMMASLKEPVLYDVYMQRSFLICPEENEKLNILLSRL